jgi:hypothetical protein
MWWLYVNCAVLLVTTQVDVEQLSPGDYVTLGLLEANPVTGSLRFTGGWGAC